MYLDTGDIKSINTDGSNLTNIFSTGSRNSNRNLVVHGDYIYCTNNGQILNNYTQGTLSDHRFIFL